MSEASPSPSPADSLLPQVLLYGRPGCHLCAEALEAIVELHRGGLRFELVEVDIESDEALLRELLEKIPVVEVDGERVSELLPDPDAVRGALSLGPTGTFDE